MRAPYEHNIECRWGGNDKTVWQTRYLAKLSLTSLDVRKLTIRPVKEKVLFKNKKMKFTIALVVALAAFASAEDSDNTLETAINFVKDCRGDYFLCVKVHNFIIKVKVHL